MTGRRLLYLNTHRLSAYAWQGGRLTVEGVFENDSDGWSRFAAYLQNQRRSHFSLLANVAEEGHVLETIPFLHGRDRQTLITRKIGQHFLGTPLAAATSLGYEKTQRKNEKLLLSGLTNPAHFEPWLQRMEKAEVALAGVYSIAQLGGALLGKLRLGAGRSLLLTLQDHSIRESYLVGGQVHFSRMAPLTDSSQAGLASAFAAEAGKLHQYLIGQRLVSRDEELPVFIVAHPQSIPAIERACPDRGPLSFTLVDSHVAAAKLKLHSLPYDNRCDRLFLQLLASQPPAQQFAGETHRHHYHLSQVRHGLIAAGLIALVRAPALRPATTSTRSTTTEVVQRLHHLPPPPRRGLRGKWASANAAHRCACKSPATWTIRPSRLSARRNWPAAPRSSWSLPGSLPRSSAPSPI